MESSEYSVSEKELLLLKATLAAVQLLLAGEREKRKWEDYETNNQPKRLKIQQKENKPKLVSIKPFRHLIRMDDKTFEILVQTVEKNIQPQNNHLEKPISAREKLIATLLYLSTGASFENLEIKTHLPASLLSIEIPKVCDILYEKLKGAHLKFPSSHAEWENIADDYNSRWGFPRCIGALGRKYIAFRDSKEDMLLALVDANCRFLYIHVDYHGRVSDGGALRRSNLIESTEHSIQNISLDKTIGNGRVLPYVIVAEDQFPFQERIMKPFPNKYFDDPKEIFNYRLSRARNTVEYAFRILASRFGVLKTKMKMGSAEINSIVKACCVLHNFLLDIKGTKFGGTPSTSTNPQTKCDKDNAQSNETNNRKQTASKIRNEFTDYFNNEGKLT